MKSVLIVQFGVVAAIGIDAAPFNTLFEKTDTHTKPKFAVMSISHEIYSRTPHATSVIFQLVQCIENRIDCLISINIVMKHSR